jgi:hypothetical protein
LRNGDARQAYASKKMRQESQQRPSRAVVAEALRARRAEIEQAALARVRSLSDPSEIPNPEYAEGLASAVPAAIEYGIVALERSGEHPPPIPTILLSQVRLAAHNRVSLDTVLRRYFAGYTILGDFMIEEAERAGISGGPTLQRLLRAHASVFDGLLAAITEEHKREAERPSSSEERRARLIERLLTGEPLDTSELEYDFLGHHLGVVATGNRIDDALREIGSALDRTLLLIHTQGPRATVWAWLGGRSPLAADAIEQLLSWDWPPGAEVVLGEPSFGLSGWRLTHRQACAAMPIAQRTSGRVVRYADVALLATALRDDVLAASLTTLFLAPLAEERDGGKILRQTLRAYFDAGRNVSTAAAALKVKRHTVTNRLRSAEERIRQPIDSCASEIEVALQLDALA